MRSRDRHISVWLNDSEYQQLQKLCAGTGLTASSLLRRFISGSEIKPKPPDAYAALLRELSAIGRNLNQIAYRANAEKHISEADIHEAARLVREAWRKVKDTL